tara:strand:+ start:727 stop:912 length:186 start_codon:yes stop_codon:yes gene_type:complete
MQFERKTRIGVSKRVFGISIKITLIILVLIFGVILIDKINFPSPTKAIEKIISNENYKVIK